jgi:hypothetical protein
MRIFERALALLVVFVILLGVETQGQPALPPSAPPIPPQNRTAPFVACAAPYKPFVSHCDSFPTPLPI